MRFLPTAVHGLIDYAAGILMIASPWLFHFAFGGWETWVPVTLGIVSIVYALLTDYELGVVPLISMPTHLVIDYIIGLAFLVSPWVFGFGSVVWVPHTVFGVVAITASLVTKYRPSHTRRPFQPI